MPEIPMRRQCRYIGLNIRGCGPRYPTRVLRGCAPLPPGLGYDGVAGALPPAEPIGCPGAWMREAHDHLAYFVTL